MASGFLFAGSFGRRPTVRAQVDDFGLTPFTIGTPRIVALIGIAEGGEPGVPRLFSSPSEAAKALRGGELLTAVKRCFDPSAEFPGASLIYAVRVNPATPATLTLKDGAAASAVGLTSANWGLQENQIKVKVEAGSVSGKKYTVAKGSELYFRDNVGRASFSIQYVGSKFSARVSITGTTLVTETQATVGTDPWVQELNISLATYNTVQKLVDFLAAQAGYTASVVTANPDEPTLNGLDFVTNQTIKAAAITVQADLQAAVDFFNSGQQPLVTAARAAGAGAAPAAIGFTFLAGGSEGTTLNSHWQAAFDALQAKDIAFVVPVTASAAIHAMADTHSKEMSKDGRKPRRAFVGAALGEKTADLTTYLARATALNSDRTILVAHGPKGFDDAGTPTTFPPYIGAAQVAGLQAGVPTIGEAITFKAIKATGLEWTPTLGELELLVAGGVLPLELAENRGFFRVTRGITTWRKNDAFHRVEISTGMALDEVVRAVVEGLEIFIGQKASPLILHRVASRTEDILSALERAGVIVGDANVGSPAFRNIVVTLRGDTVIVEFEASPVVPINFVGVTIHARTFEGEVTIATR